MRPPLRTYSSSPSSLYYWLSRLAETFPSWYMLLSFHYEKEWQSEAELNQH